MKRSFGRAACGLAAVVVAVGAVRAGDLNPPPGGIGPTMKSLDALRPGVCVNDLPGSPDAVHLISAPGMYFLNGPVEAPAGKHAIKVEFNPGLPTTGTSGVSLDLAGFPLTGLPGSLDGVHVAGASGVKVLAIQSGAAPATVGDFDGDGLDVDDVSAVEIRNIAATHCGGAGMRVRINDLEARLKAFGLLAFVTSDNGGGGVEVELAQSTECAVRVEQGVSSRNGGAGLTFRWTQVGGPFVFATRTGIEVRAVDAFGNTQAGMVLDYAHADPLDIDVSMTDVSCSRNGGPGLATGVSPGMCTLRLESCTFDGNVGSGLDASGTVSGTVRDRFGNVVLDGCRADNNGGHGFDVAGPTAAGRRKGYDAYQSRASGNALNGFHFEDAPGTRRECRGTRNDLHGHFETGDIPTEEQFANLIDSFYMENGGDGVHAKNIGLYVSDVTCAANVGDGLDVSLDPALQALGKQKSCTILQFKSSHNAGAGLLAQRVDVSVRDSDFTHMVGAGLLVERGRLLLEGSTVSACGLGTAGGDGIHCEDTEQVDCIDVTVRDCFGNGMTISDGKGSRVRGCTFAGNAGAGVMFDSTSGLSCGPVTLRDCVMDSNGGDGAAILCSSGGEVRGCVAMGNGGAGFSKAGTGHTIVWNTAADNGGAPFLVPVPGNSLAPMMLEGDVVVGAGPGYSNFVR